MVSFRCQSQTGKLLLGQDSYPGTWKFPWVNQWIFLVPVKGGRDYITP